MRLPQLEEVDRRRAQLWGLSLLAAVVVPAVIVAVGMDILPESLVGGLNLRTARLVLLAMLVAIMGYVAEREISLRRLTSLLVDERVLTASLVNRVEELNLLLRATRAMNSGLDLQQVLAQIAESAHGLLHAEGSAIMLLDDGDATMLRVAATSGHAGLAVGAIQPATSGLFAEAVRRRDGVLLSAEEVSARVGRARGEAIAVPLQLRGVLMGVILVLAGAEREAFTDFELRGVSVFADAAAASISNARAYEAQTSRVATLLEADRAKDEFLTLVTHELRTPLTSMIGLMSTMATRAKSLSDDQVAEFAGIARAQGWRLDRLIENLLDTSRAQRQALEVTAAPTAVDEVVAGVVEAMRRTLPERTITFERPLGMVRQVDADALLRIVDNLLSNAVKYTSPNTPIDVRLGEEPNGVVVEVVDHGPGVDVTEVSRLFEKFTRGPDPYERGGLGLGLYVVQALAEAHGGRVEVSETPGGGATFTVWLTAWPVVAIRT